MTIFDYLKKNCGVAIYTDEYGNTYMETKEWEYEKIISGALEISNKGDDAFVWLIPEEVYEKHSEIEIVIAGDESVNLRSKCPQALLPDARSTRNEGAGI